MCTYICMYVCMYIYVYMRMGTLRGYSLNIPRILSRDYMPTPRWLKTPTKQRKVCVAPPCQVETLETVTQDSETTSQLVYPEQGLLCSQVISRKGSQLPSEAEYLRAVNQRRVRAIVKSDQHQHRKDARRQWRNAVYL